jgi:hypothetical protein
MTTSREFRRVVLGLHQNILNRATINLAAEFAELLRLDLFGMFIEEPGVAGLAALPFVREYQTLGRQWRPIEVERYAREFELSALAARRLFTDATATRHVTCSFEVVKTSTDQAIRSYSRSTDIVIIAEPKSAVDRIAGPFPVLTSAALQSEAAVLLVPRQIARKRGPVIAIASAPDDPSIDVAVAIAAAANENVTVLAEHEHPAAATTASRGPAGVFVETVPIPTGALASEESVSSTLYRFKERLIVVTRGALSPGNEAALASIRGVPVLILEPRE